MYTNIENAARKILREYTEDLPKLINSPEVEDLLLLVRPNNFDETVRFSPGVSIFKAIYGRGKTYGIGYYTVHYCERTKECSAIYINVRRMHEIIRSRLNLGNNYPNSDIISLISNSPRVRLDLELLYIILSYLGSTLDENSIERGDLLVTTSLKNIDPKIITNIKDKVLSVEDNQKLSKLFEILVEELILKSNDRGSKLILILDEFEQIVPSPFSQVQVISDLLVSLLTSLRSERGGVLDKYPNTFALILTIQELAYPSEAMREFRKSAAPILGKIISSQDDLSIPIRFSPYTRDSIIEYYEKALRLLYKKGIINEEEEEKLLEISKCVGYYLDSLLKMPARLFFERLREVIVNITVKRKEEILNALDTQDIEGRICDKVSGILKEIFEDVTSENFIYKLYVSKEISGIDKDIILSMLKSVANEVFSDQGQNMLISEVRANGYEGLILTKSPTSAKIILYKGRSVKLSEINYRKNFIKHYGQVLTQYCSYAKGKKDEECLILIIHPDEVNIIGMYKSIADIQQIENIRIHDKIVDIPLDRDEIASLYIKSSSFSRNTDNLPLISGETQYYDQRFKEVVERIKKLTQTEVVKSGQL
jgi:hypothetical protein